MIKQFDSSYAGHIDLENVGYGGTPVNDRRYSNEQLMTAHSKAEEQAKRWIGWVMARSGWPNITSSPKAPNACRTSCCWRCI